MHQFMRSWLLRFSPSLRVRTGPMIIMLFSVLTSVAYGRPSTSALTGMLSPDIVSEGMGGTGWLKPGRETASWGNPALASLGRSVEISQSRSEINPFDEDIWHYRISGLRTSKSGWGGGAFYSHIKLGGSEDSNSRGSKANQPRENAFGATIAYDFVKGSQVAHDRLCELSGGITIKHINVDLASEESGDNCNNCSGSANAIDVGVHVGFNLLGGDEKESQPGSGISGVLLRSGVALRNLGGDVDFGVNANSPQYRNYMFGVALSSVIDTRGWGKYELLIATTIERPDVGDDDQSVFSGGAELAIINLFGHILVASRVGKVEDNDVLGVSGWTYGGTIGFKDSSESGVTGFGSAIDWASVPSVGDNRIGSKFGLRIFCNF